MHLSTVVVLPFFAKFGSAAFKFTGSKSDLLVEPLVNGSRVTRDIYENCKYTAGDASSKGEKCVVEAVKIMVGFMRSSKEIPKGYQEVVLLNKENDGQQPTITVEGAPSTSSTNTDWPTPNSKRNAAEEDEILQGMNSQLRRRSQGGWEMRAVGLGHSEIHPNGGLAIRTNVQDGDAALFVHTNGSHSTVGFKRGTSPSIGKRAGESQATRDIELKGMQGLKMQLELKEGIPMADLHQKFDDLEAGLVNLAGGDGSNPPVLKRSDAFGIATCQKTNGEMGMRGKLISLDQGAGNDFEEYGLINCDEYIIAE